MFLSLKFREQLRSNVMKKQYYLEFNFEDINSFNTNLSDQLNFKPGETIPYVIYYVILKYLILI